MEDLRAQVIQLQVDMEKVTQEMATRDLQLKDQLTSTLKEQNEVNISRLEVMLEKLFKEKEAGPQQPPVQSSVLGAAPFTIPIITPEEQGGIGNGGRRDLFPPKNTIPAIQLPKLDFPTFDGRDPSDWVMKCEYYFDIYQIPPVHRTRMAVINFVGEASIWYRQFKKTIDNPPWELLVDGVYHRFTQNAAQELIGEFKRLHQVGKVQDYIRQFDTLQTKLMYERPYLPPEFYVSTFVEGLRDDIKAMVTMFKPQSLYDAYNLAGQYELAQDNQWKRLKFVPRASFPVNNFRPQEGVNKGLPNQIGGQQKLQLTNGEKGLTFEQKRALGLCHRCSEKWSHGHKCANKGVLMIEGQDEVSISDDEGFWECEELQEEGDMLQAVISFFSAKDTKKVKNMKLKGYVGNKPVLALIDSGSTHSFVNPDVLHSQSIQVSKNNPMSVMVANGNKMITDLECKGLKFSLQGHEFQKDMRVLNVTGYDLILGLDWLTELGPMLIDWNKGSLKFKRGNTEVRLQVGHESAEVQLCQGTIMPHAEEEEGNEVLVAHLFKVEELQQAAPTQMVDMSAVVAQFPEVFQEPSQLPPHRTVDHQIPLLPDSQPISQRPYRYSYFQKLEIEKIIEELLRNNFIQPSSSAYASPILLVKKKDGTWRLCVDYRKLNANTIKDKYPIPIIDDLLDALCGAKIFSKIDLKAGYHQIRMNKEDIGKTAFKTHEGHYEYTVMPFGLTNAPATFQKLMNHIFKPYIRKFVLVFFDDILIYSASAEEHKKHLQLTLQLLQEHQLFAKRSKCEFGLLKIGYLGHLISQNGVETDPQKIEAMLHWPVQKNVRAVRGFLGLTGYYRKFIRNYGVISRPLTDQLKKGAFLWTQEAEESFNQLKKAMTQAPVLALPDFTKPFVIETDASDKGIGAVLMQGRRAIAFLSKSLGIKNQGLSTYEKEFLALLTAVQKWRHYLMGGKFVIKTDQISLKHLLEQRLSHTMQHKGMCKLLGLNYVIEYKKGCENKVADALSRREEASQLSAISEIVPKWVQDIKLSYANCEWIKTLQAKLDDGTLHTTKFTWHHDLFRFKGRLCVGSDGQWRMKLLKEIHDSSLGGHSGILGTYMRAKGIILLAKNEGSST
ncbi:polyprotein [Rhynchospora pubera]|uniref:Polyprotein n=1 Tax=Rhynchospora pubera TaxID=906938 RepID=A0AAV8HIX0_9POAL|nr:polyprotein [Rhynchospora pubera]